MKIVQLNIGCHIFHKAGFSSFCVLSKHNTFSDIYEGKVDSVSQEIVYLSALNAYLQKIKQKSHIFIFVKSQIFYNLFVKNLENSSTKKGKNKNLWAETFKLLSTHHSFQMSVDSACTSNLLKRAVAKSKTIKKEKNKDAILIYSDASVLLHKGKVGGYCAIVKEPNNDELIVSGGYDNPTESNRLELFAAIKGIEKTKEGVDIILHTDSKYVVETFNRKLMKYQKNQNINLKNLDLWDRLFKLAQKRNIEMVWVKGHNGHHYNMKCDEIAYTEAISLVMS